MSIAGALQNLGYSKKDAQFLAQHEYFHHKRKTEKELRAVFQRIADVYDLDMDTVREFVIKFPQFAGLDHKRVVDEATEVYGDRNAVKKAVMKWPQFADYNHKRVVDEATKVYGDRDAVKKAVMKHPAFVALDHKRVVDEATEVYGDREAVKKPVMKFPQFAALDHKRVVKGRVLLGKIVGLTKQDVIERILRNPLLAGYAVKRYIAAFDVARQLEREGFAPDKKMLDAYFRYVSKSPYVAGTKRKRISQAKSRKEPPLLKEMRKSLGRVRVA